MHIKQYKEGRKERKRVGKDKRKARKDGKRREKKAHLHLKNPLAKYCWCSLRDRIFVAFAQPDFCFGNPLAVIFMAP